MWHQLVRLLFQVNFNFFFLPFSFGCKFQEFRCRERGFASFFSRVFDLPTRGNDKGRGVYGCFETLKDEMRTKLKVHVSWMRAESEGATYVVLQCFWSSRAGYPSWVERLSDEVCVVGMWSREYWGSSRAELREGSCLTVFSRGSWRSVVVEFVFSSALCSFWLLFLTGSLSENPLVRLLRHHAGPSHYESFLDEVWSFVRLHV